MLLVATHPRSSFKLLQTSSDCSFQVLPKSSKVFKSLFKGLQSSSKPFTVLRCSSKNSMFSRTLRAVFERHHTFECIIARFMPIAVRQPGSRWIAASTGCLPDCPATWLPTWLAAWLAGWLADWLPSGPRRTIAAHNLAYAICHAIKQFIPIGCFSWKAFAYLPTAFAYLPRRVSSSVKNLHRDYLRRRPFDSPALLARRSLAILIVWC